MQCGVSINDSPVSVAPMQVGFLVEMFYYSLLPCDHVIFKALSEKTKHDIHTC